MEPAQLEKIILDFVNYDYDVLLATTIIESGIDIPNANTIIINQAQNFGLSDLHQMRGRVGRSNKKAFCYLLAPPLSSLTAEGKRRLQAIENFSDLGSGIHIAMQDLDIRGAGNLLGAKLPTGRGTWPAIWMLPTDWEYGDWPKSGEIDIMENVGYDPDTIVGSSHTEKYNHAIGTQKNAKIACPDCYKAFHVYALEWEEDEYRLYVDDQLYFTFKNEGTGYEVWPYDKRFHILLNLAIGGNWGGQKGIDDSLFPHVFEIDYVRVYKK
jgi:superfamily II DNA or RNA helicase